MNGPGEAGGEIELARLVRLRDRFLDATDVRGPVADYWCDNAELAAYDAVYAARIGWKWDAVVEELEERGFGRADSEVVVDWGCGTGIAARRFAARMGAGRIVLHDRSRRAMDFAAARVVEELRGVEVATAGRLTGVAPDVLLVSHVLDELDASAEVELTELCERSARVAWVEPGSRAVSRLLAGHRDRLIRGGAMRVVAPCVHHGACSALASSDDRHWCHFFAKPPAQVFTDGGWVRIGRELGIDLRSLPYAFVALTRAAAPGPAAGTARLVGRTDVGGKEARVFACDADGLHHLRAFKGRGREVFRTLKKTGAELRTVRVVRDGDHIDAIEPA